MARLYTAGFETGYAGEFTANSGYSTSVFSASTTVARTGSYSLKCDSTGSNTAASMTLLSGSFGKRWIRVWIYFTAAPSTAVRFLSLGGASVDGGIAVRLNTDGSVSLMADASVIASSSALATSTWHCIQLYANALGTSSDQGELKVNGTSIGTFTQAASTNNTNTYIGWHSAPGANKILYFDDVAINDDTGSFQNSWPNKDGKVIVLWPASDNSVGSGWQKPGGATTNLYTSINNAPPVGVADSTSSAQAENQVRNASSNTASLALNLTDYTTAGIASSDTVLSVHPFCFTGAPATTGAKSGTLALTNPTVTAASFGNFHQGTSNAGTFPTGWKINRGAIQSEPSVTKGTAPVLTVAISAGTATRIAMICDVGAMVEYVQGDQTLTPSLYSNSQSFYAPTVTPGAVTLTPSLFSNSQTFYGPTVSQPGADQNLTPSLFTNGQTFYGPTVTASYTLTPSLYSNSATFYAPTVTPGGVSLTPSLFSNSSTFYAPTVSRGTVTLTPSLFTNSQSFYGPTVTASYTLTPSRFDNSASFFAPTVSPGAVTLSPSLFTNTATFYGPTVTRGTVTLSPSLFSNSSTFYSPTATPGTVTLTPALFTNTGSFYGPTVSVGPVTLTPSLVTNSTTFYSPTVSQVGGPQTLTPTLFTNSNSFYAPTVTPGAVTLTPPLYSNSQSFYTPTVTRGPVSLTPALFSNSNTFYAPTVSRGTVTLTPALVTNSSTFYAPTVTPGVRTLTPSLFTNAAVFYGPTVTANGAPQTLTPALFTNSNTFHSPTVMPGVVSLQPALATNSQSFYAPTVSQTGPNQTLTPALFVNSHAFYGPVASPGTVTLTPARFDSDTSTFYSPTLTQWLTVDFFTNEATFFAHSIVNVLEPPLLVNQNQFYAPTVSTDDPILHPTLLVNGQVFYAHTINAQTERLKFYISGPLVRQFQRSGPFAWSIELEAISDPSRVVKSSEFAWGIDMNSKAQRRLVKTVDLPITFE